MTINAASDLASGQIAMVANARYQIEHENVLEGLFTKMTLGEGNKSQFIPKFASLSDAADLTDGLDMSDAQSMTISGTTHTTDEAGLKVIITKKLRLQLKEDAYRAAGTLIGNSMKRKIEKDGTSLFSGLSRGVGAASTAFSVAYMQAAVTQLYGQSEPCPDPIYCALHPYTYHDIKGALANPLTATYTLPEDIQRSNLTGKYRGIEPLYGVPIFICGNITSGTSCYNAIFSKQAFIYLVGYEPETWVEEDKSLRGWEIGIVADYACVEEDDNYGRYLLFDASSPTS
jgi:hypothetical protein